LGFFSKRENKMFIRKKRLKKAVDRLAYMLAEYQFEEKCDFNEYDLRELTDEEYAKLLKEKKDVFMENQINENIKIALRREINGR